MNFQNAWKSLVLHWIVRLTFGLTKVHRLRVTRSFWFGHKNLRLPLIKEFLFMSASLRPCVLVMLFILARLDFDFRATWEVRKCRPSCNSFAGFETWLCRWIGRLWWAGRGVIRRWCRWNARWWPALNRPPSARFTTDWACQPRPSCLIRDALSSISRSLKCPRWLLFLGSLDRLFAR